MSLRRASQVVAGGLVARGVQGEAAAAAVAVPAARAFSSSADKAQDRRQPYSSGAQQQQQDGSALSILRGVVGEAIQGMRDAGTFKSERVITSPQEMVVTIEGQANEKVEVVNMCANNYLGLSNHPRLVEAAKRALDSHGFGLSSVRFICGTQDLHLQLERKLSAFHGTDDTILYPSCFDANAGLFEVLLTNEDAVLSDELNHASIIDGIRLCKAQRFR